MHVIISQFMDKKKKARTSDSNRTGQLHIVGFRHKMPTIENVINNS